MAQTSEVLNEGIEEIIKLWSGGTATEMEYIVALNDTVACTAAKGSTYAAPVDPHHISGGLEEQAIDTVGTDTTNTTGDTITFDHVLTATASLNVTGIQVLNNSAGTPDKAFIECCFNAVLAMENTDSITIDGSSTIEQAA